MSTDIVLTHFPWMQLQCMTALKGPTLPSQSMLVLKFTTEEEICQLI